MKKRIVYEGIPVGPGTLVVDELSFRELKNRDTAEKLLGLITTAYIAQYVPAGIMTEAEIREKYDPENPRNVQRYWRRSLHHYLMAGSQFFVGRNRENTDDILSLVKISDGVAADKKKAEPGSIYLNDVIAAPPWHRGIGSATVHAACKFGGHSEAPLLLEGFVGSSVNTWYTEGWGLTAGELSQPFHVGNAPEQYFYSPEGHTMGEIAQRLEARNPTLNTARLE